jgi:predicted phosphodiesterase
MFLSYDTVDERFEQSMEWNNTNPYRELIVPAVNYTVFVMSDSHVGGIVNLNLFFTDALNSGAEAVLMVGDLTTGNADDFEVFQQNLPDPDSVALFPMVGNHDLYFQGWEEYYARFGSSTYYFTIRTQNAVDLFICLDSGSGTLGSEQISWFEDILKNERPNYRYCIVSTHNNLFRFRHTTSTNPVVEELYVLMELFVKYRVDMVITGHDHKKSVEKFGNTIHIITDALLDGFNQAGYLYLAVNNDNIEYTFVNF